MYGPSQVVYDLDNNKCIIAYSNDANNTHLVCAKHKSEFVRGTTQDFLCKTCGDKNHYRPTKECIYTGPFKGTEAERLKKSEKMVKAGKVKPARTLAEVLAWKQGMRQERAERHDPEVSYANYKREQFKKLGLRFFEPKSYERTDRIVEGRSGDWIPESQFRTVHNFTVIESARRDYILAVKKIQEELAAKYNPQFIQEDYDAVCLDWEQRQDVIEKVWGDFINLRNGD